MLGLIRQAVALGSLLGLLLDVTVMITAVDGVEGACVLCCLRPGSVQ